MSNDEVIARHLGVLLHQREMARRDRHAGGQTPETEDREPSGVLQHYLLRGKPVRVIFREPGGEEKQAS